MDLKRLQFLMPGRRRAAEREMREELDALEEIAGRRALGNLTLAAEDARAVWGWGWLESLARDARYALRVLARQPSFAIVAVVSLGLGIGANAAIYSLMDTLLWRQLPVREPERLVRFGDGSYSHFGYSEYADKSQEVLEGVAAAQEGLNRDLDTGGGPQRGTVHVVSGSYFPLLGVNAATGRTLGPDDDRRGSPANSIVLSYAFWQRAYNGEAAAIGKTIRVGGVPCTIVGVAPREFFGVTVGGAAADAWMPIALLPAVFPGQDWFDHHSHYLELIGRLRPGVTAAQASAALTPVAIGIDLAFDRERLPAWILKSINNQKLRLEPAANGVSYLRKRFSEPLHVLFAMVGIGLLLAAVNVMGLGFARAEGRRHELSLRLAIGAGRARLVRQLVTEAMVVALGGGVLGLAIFQPAARGMASLVAQEDLSLGIRIDANLLLFMFGMSLATALISGVAPALRSTGGRMAGGLQQGTRGTTASPGRRAIGRAAVTLQMALSVMLIAGAFLFAFSLYRLLAFDTGLNRRHLAVIDVDAKDMKYKGPQYAALHRQVLEHLRGAPGVEAASFSGNGIYTGRNANTVVQVDGFPQGDGRNNMAFFDQLGPGYFATLGTRLLAGREFDERDNAAGPKVAIVSQEFAKYFCNGRNPVGLNLYRDKTQYQIVGVVQDVYPDIRKPPKRTFYLPQLQTEAGMYTTNFVVRTHVDPLAMAVDLRSAVHAADSGVRVVSINSAGDLLNRTLDTDRMIAALSFAFGILAVTLAAVGIYGLLAYDVSRRTGEIGIRMALGATRPNVMGLVFREVASIGACGIAAGAAATLLLSKLVTKLVFQLAPGDPRVLAAAAALLTVVAAGAAWWPARRAATMDPVRALRHE